MYYASYQYITLTFCSDANNVTACIIVVVTLWLHLYVIIDVS
jgi:hypothetical protein